MPYLCKGTSVILFYNRKVVIFFKHSLNDSGTFPPVDDYSLLD
jgi:hypothetical protein